MFAGEHWTLDPTLADDPGMHQITGVDEPGMSGSPARVHTGGNSGHQAIGLAVLWGASRILLLGFDMAATRGRLHWHADHNDKTLGNPCDFAAWRLRLAQAMPDLRRFGVEVINCSRETQLHCFERRSLAHALAA